MVLRGGQHTNAIPSLSINLLSTCSCQHGCSLSIMFNSYPLGVDRWCSKVFSISESTKNCKLLHNREMIKFQSLGKQRPPATHFCIYTHTHPSFLDNGKKISFDLLQLLVYGLTKQSTQILNELEVTQKESLRYIRQITKTLQCQH